MKCSIVRLDGNPASVIRTTSATPIEEILAALALPCPRGVLVLNGGTAELAADLAAQLGIAMQDGLARVVAEEQLTVITGGTDAGLFHLFGQGLARWGRRAPCIGVSVAARVSYPGHTRGEAPLEPHHSHFVLTAGRRWGAETATMYALAAELSKACPSVAVFAGGGEIARKEMLVNVTQERQMIFLAGSGRSTDAVLAARSGQLTDDPRIAHIARQGLIGSVDITGDPSHLRSAVRRLLHISDDHLQEQ